MMSPYFFKLSVPKVISSVYCEDNFSLLVLLNYQKSQGNILIFEHLAFQRKDNKSHHSL